MTIAVVMGVSGSGKTTVAAGVARVMGWVLLEGDAFHPPANIAKMKAGTPLVDAARWPWLHASQFATLEEPGPDEHPIIADIGDEPEATIAVVVHQLTQETP